MRAGENDKSPGCLSDGCRRQQRSDLCVESLSGPAQSHQSVINCLKDLPTKLAVCCSSNSPHHLESPVTDTGQTESHHHNLIIRSLMSN